MTLRLYKSNMIGYGAPDANGVVDNWASESWIEVPGLLTLTLHRLSGGKASYVELTVAGSGLPVDLQQRILLARDSIAFPNGVVATGQVILSYNTDFVGRVDDVTPIRDSQYGQTWKITARDYIAVLTDNYVEPRGKSRYAVSASSAAPGFGVAGDWAPNWLNGSKLSAQGIPTANPNDQPFYRALIGAELAMNIVDLPSGIRACNITQVPTATISGGIFPVGPGVDLTTVTNKSIADAIRDLLADDPWIISAFGGVSLAQDNTGGVTPWFLSSDVSVQSLLLADGKTNGIPGIGTEFIHDYNPPIGEMLWGHSYPYNYLNVMTRYAMPFIRFFARGVLNFDQNIQFWYGQSGFNGSVYQYPIISYKFPKENVTLRSRARIIGRSGNINTYQTTFLKTASQPTAPGSFLPVTDDYSYGAGSYIVDNDDEVLWTPGGDAAGNQHYASRRTSLINDEGALGDSAVPMDGSANYKIEGNKLKAISAIQTPQNMRALVRGSITVPGFPRSLMGFPILPGEVINVNLPPLFSRNQFYTVDSYTYEYPADTTSIELARRPYDDLAEQLRQERRMMQAATSQAKSIYETPWMLIPGSRSITIHHNWGQIPSSIQVFAAAPYVGGGSLPANQDAQGNPVPIPGTETTVGTSTQDPNNGVWLGFNLQTANTTDVVIVVSDLLTFCAQLGRYLVAPSVTISPNPSLGDIIKVVLRG